MTELRIRGWRRRRRAVARWRSEELDLDLPSLLIAERRCAKIDVSPWSDLSLKRSAVPEPEGKIKLLMLASLLDIFDGWERRLEELGRPYYLGIWLFEPRCSRSQVVCAIGDRLHFYDRVFREAEGASSLCPGSYGGLRDRLARLSWRRYLDEDYLERGDPGCGFGSTIAVPRGFVRVGACPTDRSRAGR
jgi:hypothetical protein